MFATGLVYLYILDLGTVAQEDCWRVVFHHCERYDLSLFQLGFRLLVYLFSHDKPQMKRCNGFWAKSW